MRVEILHLFSHWSVQMLSSVQILVRFKADGRFGGFVLKKKSSHRRP